MDTRQSVYRSAVSLFASGVQRLRARRPLAWLILSVWVVAILLDAWTTLKMNGNGFEEANPINQFGMDILGVVPLVILVSLFVLVLAVWSCGRPVGLYATTILVCLLVVMLMKVLTGVSNFTLYAYGVDFLWT